MYLSGDKKSQKEWYHSVSNNSINMATALSENRGGACLMIISG